MNFFENQLTLAGKIKAGDFVVARFTNCGHSHVFYGEITGQTKNYYKVKCLKNFRKGLPGCGLKQPQYYDEKDYSKDVDRIFHVETINSRKHSVNNCIFEILQESPIKELEVY
jgi:hypothetical protein